MQIKNKCCGDDTKLQVLQAAAVLNAVNNYNLSCIYKKIEQEQLSTICQT